MIYSVIYFYVELFKLIVFSYFLSDYRFNSKKKSILIITISGLIIAIGSLYFPIEEYGIIYGGVAIAALGIIYPKKNTFRFLIEDYICICVLDSALGRIPQILIASDVSDSCLVNLICNMISLIPIIIFSYIRRKAQLDCPFEGSRWTDFFVIVFGGVSFGLYLAFVQVYVLSENSDYRLNIATSAMGLAALVFMLTFFMLNIMRKKQHILQEENRVNNAIFRIQEDYYNTILERDEETRRFRHDIRNHILCMQALIDEKDLNGLSDYIGKIMETLPMKKLNSYSDVRLLDVIVNDIVAHNEGVELRWKGRIDNLGRMTPVQISILFSNLLNNAFEAAKQCEFPYVNVELIRRDEMLYIYIQNPSANNFQEKNGDIGSSKLEDGHGYGIKNIKRVVNELDGEFELKIEELNESSKSACDYSIAKPHKYYTVKTDVIVKLS